MAKKFLYHHRTRASGAEGVHISGIQTAFRKMGFEIIDLSLFQTNSGAVDPHSNTKYHRLKKKIFNLIASSLPNIIFKIFELLYNIRILVVGYRLLSTLVSKKKTSPQFIYERYSYYNFAMAYLAFRFNIPLVIEVNTTCLDYDVRKIYFRLIAKKIENYIFNKASLITVVSNYLKEIIQAEYGIPDKKIIVTPNAINPEEFSNIKTMEPSSALEDAKKFSKGKTVIGFTGVFVPWHGLDFLIDIFSRLIKESMADSPLCLILVGDGPARKIIENKIVQNELIDNVFISGMVEHYQIKYYLELFDIAIMPDSNPFGSPMKIFEYMAMGLPIVAPAYGPILEILKDGKNSMIFSPKNSKECYNALYSLIFNHSLRSKIGVAAKKDVFKKHTWDMNVEKILEAVK